MSISWENVCHSARPGWLADVGVVRCGLGWWKTSFLAVHSEGVAYSALQCSLTTTILGHALAISKV